MADLGTIPAIYTHTPPVVLHPITGYTIHRGLILGALPIRNVIVAVARISPLSDYVVRQIRVLFRQIWPARGQRFPQ